MRKTLRYSSWAIASVVVVALTTVLFINYTIKNKVENFVASRLPSNFIVSYDELSLNIFSGTLTYANVSVAIKNTKTDAIHTTVKVPEFIIEDISYFDYLFSDEIHIEDIKLFKSEITYFKHHFNRVKDSTRTPVLDLIKPVLIDELSIDNATVTIFENDKNEKLLYVQNATVEIDDILISSETLANRIPLNYSDYEAKSDSLFVKVSSFENLTAHNFALKDHQLVANDIRLWTKVSEQKLSEIIPVERDHFTVRMESLNVRNLDFGFEQRELFTKSTAVSVKDLSAEVFRDKLVADNLNTKRLYSRVLRELPFKLTIDSVDIQNGFLKYRERVKADNSGGEIVFKKLNVQMKNVSNTYQAPVKTEVAIQANLMKSTPVSVNWNFDVNDVSDHFIFKIDMGHLAAEDMNSFMQPNLGVQFSGEVNKVYMTTDGNRNMSRSDVKLNYDNFKINILRKDGKKKNKLFSAIANIFIENDSKEDNSNFSEVTVEVMPDKTKSFFNYIWLNLDKALKKSLIGI
ncbi:hypothetical protein [Ulvibacter antarcticus]|uniref:DUF748 domain-containing protein n=1 Tax=Ulvibacter antarcticus TaxID=442714 RepID=A0A3L9Z8C7_9FLAO|nr:hypothetical protein [Ulvibacter antarcticus]RMA66545.1 hypothetical protein BXY75_0971 [Ulvibacter antarcticus]